MKLLIEFMGEYWLLHGTKDRTTLCGRGDCNETDLCNSLCQGGTKPQGECFCDVAAESVFGKGHYGYFRRVK